MFYSTLDTKLVLKDDDFLNKKNPDGHSFDTNTVGFGYSLTYLKSLDRGRSFFVRLKLVDLDLKKVSGAVANADNTQVGTATLNGNQQITNLSLGMAF